jgi:hypothetical protein
MPPTPASERATAARAAAEMSWANTTDRSARTAPARAALWQRFLNQVDGDETRARHLWKAHFATLALKSAQSRRRASEATAAAQSAETELDRLGSEDRGKVRPGA